MPLFNKILIANRGEIACRIIQTARQLAIKTVAIFSEADSNALHVKLADEAYLLGPAPSQDSYLNSKKILAIAKRTQVSAIHPGYGFLSENSHFARLCEQENIIFIGPHSSVIDLMGNKKVAKEIMHQHDVPVLPWFYTDDQSQTTLINAAKKIGFPIVLKAIAGGGGKGLRLVQEEANFAEAYHAVRREAKAFFNDERLFIEKYLPNARHIEVQLLADHYGHVQTLLTRDCSIQRRHQKIIEEAPAPLIPPDLHNQLLGSASRAAKVIEYTNAGTIEFLVESNNFYFMEMNTRLQVEHPVTEMITGIDIVEWQLRIAAGEALSLKHIEGNGHAIEVRLNAEDPEKDFIPSAGKLHYFHFPTTSAEVRIDTGYLKDDTVNIYYDSLLAKLIVWGKSRSLAINRLQQLLNDTVVIGIKTNLPLLKKIIQHHNFINAKINTHFLQKEQLTLAQTLPNAILVLSALFLKNTLRTTKTEDSYSPWQRYDGWQMYFNSSITFYLLYQQKNITVQVIQDKNTQAVRVANELIPCTLLSFLPLDTDIYRIELLIENEYYTAVILKNDMKIEVMTRHNYYQLQLAPESMTEHYHDAEEQLLAPMPGTIVALHVNSGQKVARGDKLLVIEAMKMEHTLYAPRDGVIKSCHYQLGDLIKEGVELIEFEADFSQ